MLDSLNRFVIKDYARLRPFCSFLPGISGETGIPLWCYYVNRGQAVASFGVEDKEHSIMEFSPAHQAYMHTARLGFRTFIKLQSGLLDEPFGDSRKPHEMRIGMNTLTISEKDKENSILTEVDYATLPDERAAGLIRRVTITNIGIKSVSFDILDGMPAIIPYGVSLQSIKSMAQTSKAWMQAENSEGDIVFFRVRASMEDSSVVRPVEGVNFACACDERGNRTRAWVDPSHVFGYDDSYTHPMDFESASTDEWTAYNEAVQNQFPCCFYLWKCVLEPGESRTHYMLIGHAESKALASTVCGKALAHGIIDAKLTRAEDLAKQLTDVISTHTGNPIFDMYCRQTYLDNLLRGGYPRALRNGEVMYLYSRKHGDPERDYNAFRMLPEYMSQGNGNFRDVNQNRRCDVLFEPCTGEYNIKLFFDLIQADGYNPLVVERVLYTLDEKSRVLALENISNECRKKARELLSSAFTPGKLRMALDGWQLRTETCPSELFETIMTDSVREVSASFGEGYWSDHWTYNLDQIESYLSIYPERKEALLYDERQYSWYESPVAVLPCAKRYVLTENGVRRHSYLENRTINGSRLLQQNGDTVLSVLMEKLLLLCAVKCASLDPCGMGVDMEGGKPGWYDALNGLPALGGSSMPETLALYRLISFVHDTASEFKRSVDTLAEIAEFACRTAEILKRNREEWNNNEYILCTWMELNEAKEGYRTNIYTGASGERAVLTPDEILEMCAVWLNFTARGIERAVSVGGGLIPTYFTYKVTEYTQNKDGITPTAFIRNAMPGFLEGQVGYLKLPINTDTKHSLYETVKDSKLYDAELNMYKVNAPLANASYEIGRARAFTPGWLENESIWLHMEYKYLLELLRSELYNEFEIAFEKAAIPFLSFESYGRSTLENSSFIASSANPDSKARGKGFVARLSGSTAEFLSIWQIMLLGGKLFTFENGELSLRLSPMLPSYLTKGCSLIEATLLGRTKVIYEIEANRCYVPGEYVISDFRVIWNDGTEQCFEDSVLRGCDAVRVRNREALQITARLNVKGGSL